jgi:uncharacterized protein YjbI with pentapeptide repeats
VIIIDTDFTNRANTKRMEYLLKTEELVVKNKKRWFAFFEELLHDGCNKILELQDRPEAPAIASLEYTMLYDNFINRQYLTDLFVYGEKLYADKTQRFISSYDISDLFIHFDKLWNDLLALRKRYVGKVSAQDVTSFMLQTLPEFYAFLQGIARFAVADLADKRPFTNIIKSEKFVVNIGDFMAKTHTVYTEWKNNNELAVWLVNNPENVTILGDYSGLDFSGIDLSQLDLSYTQFRGSTLVETNFYGSILTGANFRNANMKGCYIEECSILEADFSYANLMNASFMYAEPEILTVEKELKFPRLLPTCLHCADLTDADFNGANLVGADFSGAVLTGADFTGANLTGADLTGAELTGTVFTDAILDGIRLS